MNKQELTLNQWIEINTPGLKREYDEDGDVLMTGDEFAQYIKDKLGWDLNE